MQSLSWTTDTQEITASFNGSLITVLITDIDNIRGRGNALQHPDDAFDMVFGIKLALARASSRYFKKLEKALVKETK